MGRSIPGDARDVADLLASVSRRIRRAGNGALEPLGLTGSQARALRAVVAEPGLRMSDLAGALRIARRSATDVADDLAERGLVTRHDDPEDRRAVVLRPTPAARRLLRDVDRRRSGAVEELTARLSASELRDLRRLLTVLDAPDGG